MSQPIGVFDSGIGGLTVVRHLFSQLPNESIIYFGDTARVPYGSKSRDTIRRYALESARFMMVHHVKYIVVACNSTSAVAIDDIRNIYKNPVIGVIKPGSMAAVKSTRNGSIGVIGTKATINSQAYSVEISQLNSDIKVYSQACPLFVPLVEEGLLQGSITDSIIQMYLEPLLKKNIDTLVLGCTHYPLLKETIQKVTGSNIVLIDSGEATAEVVKKQIHELGLLNENPNPDHKFFVSDSVQDFERVGSRFLGYPLPPINKADLEEYFTLK